MGSFLKASLIVPKGVGKREQQNASEVVYSGKGSTRQRALKLTNAYAYVLGIDLSGLAKSKKTASGVGRGGSGYVIVHPAKATKARVKKSGGGPVKSRKIRGLIGLGVGLVLGAVIVLMREVLNRRLRTAARAEAHFGYPVVAEIPAELRAIGRPATKRGRGHQSPDRLRRRPTGCCGCRSCSSHWPRGVLPAED